MDLDFEQYESYLEVPYNHLNDYLSNNIFISMIPIIYYIECLININQDERRKKDKELKSQVEVTQVDVIDTVDKDKKEKKKHKKKRSRSRSQEKKKKHHHHKHRVEEVQPQPMVQVIDNSTTDVERQREAARKKRIDIIKAEIRDLERKITEMERAIDEARRQDLTVLMYSLPLKAKEKHIYQFYQMYQCGKIRDIRIIRDQRSGRSRGVAYIEFYQDESIPMALALNDRLFIMDGKEVQGQAVKIQMSQAEKNRAARDQKQMQARQARLQAQTQDLDKITGPARIQITGLLEQMTDFNENEIRDAFEPFGDIQCVEIPRDEFGRNNGMAYVTFAKAQAAKDAIETINENFQINGKRIKVQVVTSGIFDLNMEIDDDFLNNPSMRLSLMQKLMKDDQLESINLPPLMSQLGITIAKIFQGIQSANPGAGCISGWKPFSHVLPQCPVATKCVVLGNMWTHEDVQNQTNLIQLKEEVENECRKYGDIDMVWVDQKVEGNVLVLFKQEAAAQKVKTIMNMRKFGDKLVLSFYITETQFFNIIR